MFGALNRFISRLDSDPNVTSSQSTASQKPHGFQVLRNNDTNIPLEPWFDFIIGINGHNIDNPDPNLFLTEIKNCAGSTISLGVFAVKGQQVREVYVTVPHAGGAIGLALQWSPLSVAEDVWHILDVIPNSPADVAGLLPYSDYVIGSPERALRGDAGLGELIEEFLNRPLRLFVYNQEYDVTRLITITPAKNWGGDGALGCVLGYGALHRIPAPLTEPTQGPGETLFEASGTNQDEKYSLQEPAGAAAAMPPASADFLVPANMQFAQKGPSPPPAGGPPTGKPRKQRAHHSHGPAAKLDDYLAEGEQKSRELDSPSTPKPSGGLPPPPKAGGPPKASSPAPETES